MDDLFLDSFHNHNWRSKLLYRTKELFAPETDRPMRDRLVQAEVFGPHLAEKIGGQQLCSYCADGFRPHYKRWIARLCFAKGGDDAFFHTPAGNGDPMRFAYESPLSYFTPDDWGRLKTAEIAQTLRWATELEVDVEQHRLVHHWPCKAALDKKVSFWESILLVAKGKMRLKHQMPGLKVSMEVFIDWSAEEFEVYSLSKEALVRLISTDPEFAQDWSEWQAYEARVRQLPVLYNWRSLVCEGNELVA